MNYLARGNEAVRRWREAQAGIPLSSLPSLFSPPRREESPIPLETETLAREESAKEAKEAKKGPSLPLESEGTTQEGLPLSHLLALDLRAFAEAGACLEVRVPWHDVPLWFVPTEADAEILTAEGVSRGLIWTARELMDLMALGLPRGQVQTLARAKLAVDGDVVLWRPTTSPTPTTPENPA
jgi:hypothetical protein